MSVSPARIAILLCLPLCVACAAVSVWADAPPVCAGCGESVEIDSWIKIDGRDYHPDCFRCAHCSQPIGDDGYYRHNNRYYDRACFTNHIAPRCDLCDEILDGPAIVDFFDNRYCAFHEGADPRCTCCGRFISDELTDGGRQYDDGRQICNLCLALAVFGRAEGRAVLSSTRDRLATFGIYIEGPIRLHMIGQTELRQRSEGFLSDPQGVATYRKETKSDGLVLREDFEIYSLRGLPRLSLSSVLAHELMHIWLFQNAAADLDPALCEGACNYVSYLVVTDIDSEHAAMLLDKLQRDVSPIYGDGFRRTAEYVARVGVENWLNYMRIHQTPPW